MSRPTLFTGDDNSQGRDSRNVLPRFGDTAVGTRDVTAGLRDTEFHTTPSPFSGKQWGPTSTAFERQDDIDHRENQLNARMAQFETLVRNTKVSLQTKMDEIAQREDELRKGEEQLQNYRITFEEQFDADRRALEHDQVELQTRKQAVEERLVRRERELSEIAAEREREIAVQAEEYRQKLESQLVDAKSDFQCRFEVRCQEVEGEFMQQFAEEKKKLEMQERALHSSFDDKSRQLDQEIAAKKSEMEIQFKKRFEEMDRQAESRKKETEEASERRITALNDDFVQKRNELEERYHRREDELERREMILHQAEEEWNQRRNSFESQWNDFEGLRKTKAEELTRRETKADDRERYIVETEARLKKKEMELAALSETLKAKELQNALTAKKYANLQEMQIAVEESQSEVSRIREALVRERHQLQKTNETERKRLRDAQELALKRLEEERQDVVKQSKRLEQMRLVLDRSREELGKMHRETLEVRLATEELWLRLAGESGSEDLKKSVGKIQARLAAEYQDAVGRLEIQKQELKQIQAELIEKQEGLTARKTQLDQLTEQSELIFAEREQAMKIREEELERRRLKIEEQTQRVQQDRAEMENEVRMLQTQIDAAFGKNAA